MLTHTYIHTHTHTHILRMRSSNLTRTLKAYVPLHTHMCLYIHTKILHANQILHKNLTFCTAHNNVWQKYHMLWKHRNFHENEDPRQKIRTHWQKQNFRTVFCYTTASWLCIALQDATLTIESQMRAYSSRAVKHCALYTRMIRNALPWCLFRASGFKNRVPGFKNRDVLRREALFQPEIRWPLWFCGQIFDR
jgi:hypothetical protein